jgi:NitT/TauT family transport system substrate-binding protein
MISKQILWSGLISLALVVFLMGACSQPEAAVEREASEPTTIRLAVLPILDTLPLYVADSEGYFSNHKVKIEFIPVASAPERDQLIAAGQADGIVNEILSTMFFNRELTQVQTIRYARTASASAPLFHILVSAQSGIVSGEGLKNTEIGISQGTIIEYLTDRILESQNFNKEEIKTVAVPKISDRLALLASGELDAAMLPDPLSFLAEQQGAYIVLDDSVIPNLSFSTITFRKDFIDQNPEAIRGFLAAIEEATERINSEPEAFVNLLSERQLVPQPILEAYQINPYPTAGIPSQEQWEDVLAWAQEKGLLEGEVSYSESVTDAFLPK